MMKVTWRMQMTKVPVKVGNDIIMVSESESSLDSEISEESNPEIASEEAESISDDTTESDWEEAEKSDSSFLRSEESDSDISDSENTGKEKEKEIAELIGDDYEKIPDVSPIYGQKGMYSNMESRLKEIIDDPDAFETKVIKAKKIKAKKRKQEFVSNFIEGTPKGKFFNLPITEEISLEELKKDWENRGGEDFVLNNSTDVLDISKKKKKKFVKEIKGRIQEIRDFVVNEIAPVELSVFNAFEEAKQELELLTGGKVEQSSRHIEAMVSDAVAIKMFHFISELLSLTEDQKKVILKKHLQRRQVDK